MTIESQQLFLGGALKLQPKVVEPGTTALLNTSEKALYYSKDKEPYNASTTSMEVLSQDHVLVWEEMYDPSVRPGFRHESLKLDILTQDEINLTQEQKYGQVIGMKRLYTWKPTKNDSSSKNEALEEGTKLFHQHNQYLDMVREFASRYNLSAASIWNLRGERLTERLHLIKNGIISIELIEDLDELTDFAFSIKPHWGPRDSTEDETDG